jgi:hypothetical protein
MLRQQSARTYQCVIGTALEERCLKQSHFCRTALLLHTATVHLPSQLVLLYVAYTNANCYTLRLSLLRLLLLCCTDATVRRRTDHLWPDQSVLSYGSRHWCDTTAARPQWCYRTSVHLCYYQQVWGPHVLNYRYTLSTSTTALVSSCSTAYSCVLLLRAAATAAVLRRTAAPIRC